MYFNPYALPLFFSGLILLLLAYRAWSFRFARGAKYFAFLVSSCAVYCLAYSMEISSSELEIVFFWLRIEYVGIAMIPPAFILFAVDYTGWRAKLSAPVVAALFIIPIITIALFLTTPGHGLIYSSAQMDTSGPFPVIVTERGFWYWVQGIYVILAIAFSNILFVLMWQGSNQVYRKQVMFMMVASFIPWVGYILYLTRPIPWNIDMVPFFLALSGIFSFVGLSRYRFFDLIPIARTKLFEELPDGALIIDSKMRIADLNTAMQHYLGITSMAIGSPVADALKAWPKLASLIKPVTKAYHLEMRKDMSDPHQWFRIDFLPLQDSGLNFSGQMIIFRDITELKAAEEKLNRLATTDDLTGLWNRRYFMQASEKELKRAQRYGHFFSMIMIDIDWFKDVNDTYGHSAGDKTLQDLAGLITSRLREVDVTARLGGEEFGVLLPSTNLDCAFNLAEDIREIVENTPVVYEGKEIFVTVSGGVTTYHSSISGIEDMLKAADQALYRAKANGRNQTMVKQINPKM
jgi:diguanylate cyclase (GGDEF)-like protein